MTRTPWMGVLVAILSGCTMGGAPPFPAYPSMEEALGEVLSRPVTIEYREDYDAKRALVLFRTETSPGLSATLLERAGFGKWRMSKGVGLNGSLPSLGALTYSRENLGYVEERVGSVTHSSAETHVIFGEVLDPLITWVELTLYDQGAKPIRARVQNGVWVVQVPPEKQNTWYELRGGNADGTRFVAGVGSGSKIRSGVDPANAPMVEYRNAQMGVRLEHPANASVPEIDQDERLVLGFRPFTVTLKRRPDIRGETLAEWLQAEMAQAGEQVLDQGLVTLGGRQAGYLLEARPQADAPGFAYHSRYLVLTDSARYEVDCAVVHVFRQEFWAENLKPTCDKVLGTIEFLPGS